MTPFESVTCLASVTPFSVLTFLTTLPSSRNFSISGGLSEGAAGTLTAVCAVAVHGAAARTTQAINKARRVAFIRCLLPCSDRFLSLDLDFQRAHRPVRLPVRHERYVAGDRKSVG